MRADQLNSGRDGVDMFLDVLWKAVNIACNLVSARLVILENVVLRLK